MFWSIYEKILSYCWKSRKNTETKNLEVVETKNGRIMLLSKYAGIKAPISKILLVGPILF